jgi:hypothetical protein
MEKQFYSKLVGVTKENADGRNRQTIIQNFIEEGEPLILEREPENEYDNNAIAAYVVPISDPWGSGIYQVGYLPREMAAELAPLMDQGNKVYCEVSECTGGTNEKRTLGVNISLSIFSSKEIEEYRSRHTQNLGRRQQDQIRDIHRASHSKISRRSIPGRSNLFYGFIIGLVIGILASIGHFLQPAGTAGFLPDLIANTFIFTILGTIGVAVVRKFIKRYISPAWDNRRNHPKNPPAW